MYHCINYCTMLNYDNAHTWPNQEANLRQEIGWGGVEEACLVLRDMRAYFERFVFGFGEDKGLLLSNLSDNIQEVDFSF